MDPSPRAKGHTVQAALGQDNMQAKRKGAFRKRL